MTHYSPSQISMYGRCAEQYRRRYVEGERLAPGIAMIRGSAVHDGARINFRQKIDSHADLPANEIVEAAAASFYAATHGTEITVTAEEAGRGVRAVIDEALDETTRLAHAHATMQAPDYQPVLVEERVQIASGIPDIELHGILDLADDKGRVVDLKTKAKSPNPDEANKSIQLTIYAAMHTAKTLKPPTELRLDVLTALKREVKRTVLVTKRTTPDYVALGHRIATMAAAIKAGNFPPTTPDNWACSPNWCGYYRTCKYVNAGG